MKQRKGKRSFIKRRMCSLFLVLVLLITFGVQPAFAATSYVSNISITLNVDPVPGESLPGLSVGYIGDDCDVMISNNSKYDIKSAKWSVSKEEVRLGGKYTMKITLEAINDYRFNSSYSSSKVTVKGGTFVSAQKQSSTKLVVTVKTKEAKGTLESPEEAYWVNYSYGRDKFGYAKWEDVDNAAYSNVRRFINQGTFPPVDAIRTEEFLNYFAYDYPAPRGNDPVSITTEVSNAPWNTQHKLVHIGIKAKEIATENLPASNLVFLIDVSGSMSDANKLPLLKSSLK